MAHRLSEGQQTLEKKTPVFGQPGLQAGPGLIPTLHLVFLHSRRHIPYAAPEIREKLPPRVLPDILSTTEGIFTTGGKPDFPLPAEKRQDFISFFQVALQ